MSNSHISQRLKGIQDLLIAAHKCGKSLSNTSKGAERESFIENFLSNVLTPQFRFGHGDVTDLNGNRSGQLDVVIEYPWVPSYL